MVASKSMQTLLEQKGFRKLCRWSRGVDLDLFRSRDKTFLPYKRPILLYVGRVAVEKNIEAFLEVRSFGTKVVVGDGPQLLDLMRRHPDVHFVGAKFGEELAQYYSSADVFVFPSRTDVFGNVQLEALASGVPIAAFPVPGPLDVIGDSGAGALDEDLQSAICRAMEIPPEICRARAMHFSWIESTNQFLRNLRPIKWHCLAPFTNQWPNTLD
jgi:glycosyltransferase involved in cell wall biosynthesis